MTRKKSASIRLILCCGTADCDWEPTVFPYFSRHHGDPDSGIDILTATLIPTIFMTFNTVAYLSRYI